MIALLVITAIAANVSLVVFAADALSPKSPTSGRAFEGTGNATAGVRLAA